MSDQGNGGGGDAPLLTWASMFVGACKAGTVTDAEKIAALIKCCREYHDALDMAFAMLGSITGRARPPATEQFYPSRSPMWLAVMAGDAVVKAIEETQ